jgi:hypothetical protein
MKTKNAKVELVRVAPSLQSAVRMAALGFVKEESVMSVEDVKSHLQSGELIYHIFVGKSEAGFAIFAVCDDILYLSGIIIIPEFQSMGINGLVVQQARLLYPQCKYLALRTQSLRMYLAASRLCREFYPTVENLGIPENFASRGQQVAKMINSKFPVHQGCYGGPLYGAKPDYKDKRLQNLWDELCNFERGDAIIFIGMLL